MYGVGIVGAGAAAKNFHLPAVNEIPNAEVRGIADIDIGRARKLCERYRIPDACSSHEELLQTDIDVVHICTPVSSHHQVVMDCAKAGKHVLIEKPLCLTAKEAREMLEVTNKHGVKATLVQNQRFAPGILEMKRFYDKFMKEHLLSIRTTCHVPLPATKPWMLNERNGLLYEVGAHDLDLQLHFVGKKVKSVHAVPRKYYDINFVSDLKVFIEFEDNVLGMCDFSWISPDATHNIEIYSTVCNMFSDFRGQFIVKFKGQCSKVPSDAKFFRAKILSMMGVGKKPRWYTHQQLIARFYESIEKNTEPPVPLEQGLRNTVVMESISNKIGGKECEFV